MSATHSNTVLARPPTFVLVEPSHPGNIGGVARAMKTMGLERLVLVKPKHFPSPDATTMAAGANEILEQAKIVPTLAAALVDHNVILGSSARLRHARWQCLTPHEAMHRLVTAASGNRLAVVFGRESSGLSNREMDLCQYQLHIPCHARFSSLNLASAAQIVAYEWRLAAHVCAIPGKAAKCKLDEPANSQIIEALYLHLEQSLEEKNFFNGRLSETVMRKFRQIFQRTHLNRREVNLLRGTITTLSESRDAMPSSGHEKRVNTACDDR